MTLPNYQVTVTSLVTGRTLAIYDSTNFYSLRYSRKVNDIGVFVIVFPYESGFWTTFDTDNFVEIYRTSPITGSLILEETYLARARHRFREGNEEKLVIGGVSLTHLLARRVIDPDDDPTATDGYSRKNGAADTIMRAYVREHAGDLASAGRFFPGLTVESVLGTSLTLSKNFRYDNLFTALQEMANGSGVDFYVTRTDLNLVSVWIAEIGSDMTRTTNEPQRLPYVVLAPARGNLQDPSINIDRTNEKNFVYCLGQGQGEQRLVVKDSTADASLTAFNRIEFVKDARNIDKLDSAALQDAATAALNEKKTLHEFTFRPTGYDEGSIYRKDWDVADFVTAIWDTVETDLRIDGVEIEISDAGESLDVTVQQIMVT
jgi:hypothetical protein